MRFTFERTAAWANKMAAELGHDVPWLDTVVNIDPAKFPPAGRAMLLGRVAGVFPDVAEWFGFAYDGTDNLTAAFSGSGHRVVCNAITPTEADLAAALFVLQAKLLAEHEQAKKEALQRRLAEDIKAAERAALERRRQEARELLKHELAQLTQERDELRYELANAEDKLRKGEEADE